MAGSGKTTLGRLLAEQLSWSFYDADEFHPPANRHKMAQGIPLSEEDRLPWLQRLEDLDRRLVQQNEDAVWACSALKAAYRRRFPRATWVYLHGDRALLAKRLASRTGHFFPPQLLESQLALLEPPAEAIWLEVDRSPSELLAELMVALQARGLLE